VFAEARDSDTAIGKVGADLEFTAQGFDKAGERPHVHVAAALHLRNGRLILVQDTRQMFLGEVSRFPASRIA
jgi:hypothetical protein